MLQATASTDLSTTLTNFVMAMVGLSVAAERVTETIKQWIWPSGSPTSPRNAAMVQTLAIISGVLVSALSGLNPLSVKDFVAYQWSNHADWMCWCVTGLLVCGGSAFWNHLLDILQATKVQKEQVAYRTGPAPVADVPQLVVAAVPVPAGD
ncbi:MAG TPA: hypothetical protein VG267_10105 [Terracidiphilus sp.]|jgi:hypothetical protein|nr:hypothetical protein [Terracidiphilus sp.]